MENNTATTQEWEKTIAELSVEVEKLKAQIKWYEEQFRLLQRQRFGAKSEKSSALGIQLSIFNEAEEEADATQPEPEIEEIHYTRRKKAGKRDEDLAGLPTEAIVHELAEEDRICPECGGEMNEIGRETVRREIEIIPAQAKVVEHVACAYGCRHCGKESDRSAIVKAEVPEPVIKGSVASPSAVAHVMHQKFVMGAPLYRQEKEFQRRGVALSRQTMANWMIKCSDDWLWPVYARIKELMLKEDILYADETTVQVLREPGRDAQSKSYMWLYRSGGPKPGVLYEYQPGRGMEYPRRFLAGWRGFLHSDGYSVYHSIDGVTAVGCWAHCRRNFSDALAALPKSERPGSSAGKGLEYINRLFELERLYGGEKLTHLERFERRLAESKPVAEEFFAWAGSLAALPKSAIGKATAYAANQKEWLMNVYLDGRLEISNNRSERSIKSLVIGRKAWLFCCTPDGARASAVIYSIVETAKENMLDVFEYLKFLFEVLPNSTSSAIDSVLPWSDALPERCRSRQQPKK